MRRQLVLCAGAALALLWVAARARGQGRPDPLSPLAASDGSRDRVPTGPAPAAVAARLAGRAPFAAASVHTAVRSAPQALEERSVLRAAAAATVFGTRAGRLAGTRSGSPEVRAFAAGLVRHHEVVGLEMLPLLQARGMAMPMLENRQSLLLARLQKLNGPSFDREFMQAVGVQAQRSELRALEAARQGVGDPLLRDWIERSLPGLRQQLALAEAQGLPTARSASTARRSLSPADPAVTPVDARLGGSRDR